MNWKITPGNVGGRLSVPGDKSIAHRAVMIASIASGPSTLRRVPFGRAVRSTMQCMTSLGATVAVDEAAATLKVSPRTELMEPDGELDSGNSGTTARLLAGILAGQDFSSELTGDQYLRKRPMTRIIEPLGKMGARITSKDGNLPLLIRGGGLRAIRYRMPIASAQVKSSILLAGLFAEGVTTVVEPTGSRDHTERMLMGAGVEVQRHNAEIQLAAGRPQGLDMTIPGDFSSAAFFLCVAALQGTEVTVDDVGLNETRIGFVRVLERMGATVELLNVREQCGEPIGSVRVTGKAAKPIILGVEDIPALIDELPLVVLLASQANGESLIRGAAELRVKESDRVASVTNELGRLGAAVQPLEDGFVIRGPSPLRGSTVQSHADHRIAMMLAVAGTVARGQTVVEDAGISGISYPEFASGLAGIGGRIDACA